MKKHIIANLFLLSSFYSFAQGEVNLFSGNQSGIYYNLGEAICDMVNCQNNQSFGSVDNVRKIELIPDSLAIVQADILKDNKEELIVIKELYVEAYSIAVREDSKINSLEDLKGKVVNLDKVNSGSYASALTMFKAYGLNLMDFAKISNLPVNKDLAALCENQIDASFHIIGHPNSSFQAVDCKLRFIPLNDKIAEDLVNQNSELKFIKIKSKIYYFNNSEIRTIGVPAILVASKKMSPKLLKKITEDLNKNYNKLKEDFYHNNSISLE